MFFKKEINNNKLRESVYEQPEEWVWVEGYKGTDKNMCCRDFQYSLGQVYEEDGEIEQCENGFHLCLELIDVFDFYDIREGNRFFKVRALVRKTDLASYGREIIYKNIPLNGKKILAAKSIEFISELSVDEVCDTRKDLRDLDKSYKKQAMETSCSAAIFQHKIDTLIRLGYTEELAKYIVQHNRFDIAYALNSLKDLSTDVKISLILNGK